MTANPSNKILRVAALTAVLCGVLFIAGHFCGNFHPKTLGALLGAAAVVFFLGETYFWKAIDKLTELPFSDALNASEADDLASTVKRVKSNLTKRWFTLLALKAIAAMCAAWLLNQQERSDRQQFMWLVGVGALTVSLPMALTFLRNWQQADEIKTRQILIAKQKKELKTALEELSKPPATPVEANKMLAGYAKVLRPPKPKV